RRDTTLFTARVLAFGLWHPTLRPWLFVTQLVAEGSPSHSHQVGPDDRLVCEGNGSMRDVEKAGRDFLRLFSCRRSGLHKEEVEKPHRSNLGMAIAARSVHDLQKVSITQRYCREDIL
ncbi:MAG: hypothetical protein AAF764_09465, partial [Pseudomonadota bacterium]